MRDKALFLRMCDGFFDGWHSWCFRAWVLSLCWLALNAFCFIDSTWLIVVEYLLRLWLGKLLCYDYFWSFYLWFYVLTRSWPKLRDKKRKIKRKCTIKYTQHKRTRKQYRKRSVPSSWYEAYFGFGSAASEPPEPPDFRHYAQEFDDLMNRHPDLFDFTFGLVSPPHQTYFLTKNENGTSFTLDLTGLNSFYSQVSSAYLAQDQAPIIFDTGASISVSPFQDDFIDMEPSTNDHSVVGLTHPSNVQGVGHVRWTLQADDGTVQTVITHAYYVPDAHVQLFSVQSYINSQRSGEFRVRPNKTTFQFPFTRKIMTFQLDTPGWSNLPIASIRSPPTPQSVHVNVTDDSNVNLTSGEKELLTWHFRLGHFNLRWIRKLTQV